MLAGTLLALFNFPSGVQLKIEPRLNLAYFRMVHTFKNEGIFDQKKNIGIKYFGTQRVMSGSVCCDITLIWLINCGVCVI